MLSCALVVAGFAGLVYALDPPHDVTNTINCSTCHTTHSAPGGAITKVAGNANLCQSCHVTGGLATGKPFAEADQAFVWPGLPAGTSPAGTSHRWDSGASGHVKAQPTNTSTGKVQSGGAFTGRYAKTYTLTITTAGDVGLATFSWTDTLGGSGSGTTGTNVALNEGITVTFTNGTSPSFVLNDQWRVYVRTDINQPTTAAMAARISDGKIMCSTCHNEHSQSATPFDPNAPAYGGSGTGAGRHYQRIADDTNQMCKDCHSARNVTLSSQGSHPVAVSIPGTGFYKSPTSLPLDKTTTKVQCTTCHKPHYAPSTDGTLRRLTNVTTLCTDCHTLADTTTPATHLNTSTGVLWPGGQYGSTFPQITDAGKRGFCTNCHQPHGWPDTTTPSQDYPKLLVEQNSANLCFTCHDGSPASNQMTDFSGTIWVTAAVGASNNMNLNTRHDVKSADQAKSGAVIKCSNCHDPHTAKPTAKVIADPDPGDGRVPAPGQTWTGSDLRSEWCLDCHDGSFPSTITPPTTALVNIRATYSADAHGAATGAPTLRSGYGWAKGDILPCTACHDPGHGTSNLFQLRTTVYSKDGTTPIPSDGGSTTVAVTNNNIADKNVNGYYFCNTCHTGSMGGAKTNCFACHYHSTRF